MAALSTLRLVSQFLFGHSNMKHQKYQQLLHPLIASLSTSAIFMFITIMGDKYFGQKNEEEQMNFSESKRLMIGLSLMVYLGLMIMVRHVQNGHQILYELIWACNMCIMSSIYAIFKNKGLILNASMITVSVDQVLWYIDIIGFLITKKFPIGVAKYLTWPTTTRLRILTSFHHILFIPLCFGLLWKQANIPFQSWYLSCGMTFSLSILARLFCPHSIIGRKETTYLNVNLSHELWKDVKISLLSVLDGADWHVAIPFLNLVWNLGNLVFGYVVLNVIFQQLKGL